MVTANATNSTQRTLSIPKLCAPVEVAQMLSVSLRTVRNWIRTGDLAHTRLGTGKRLIRVREDDLVAFLDRRYQPVQTPAHERQDRT